MFYFSNSVSKCFLTVLFDPLDPKNDLAIIKYNQHSPVSFVSFYLVNKKVNNSFGAAQNTVFSIKGFKKNGLLF